MLWRNASPSSASEFHSHCRFHIRFGQLSTHSRGFSNIIIPPVTPLSSFFIIIICEDEVSEICFTSRLLAVKPAAGIYYPSFTLRQVLSLALRIRKAGLKQTRGAGKWRHVSAEEERLCKKTSRRQVVPAVGSLSRGGRFSVVSRLIFFYSLIFLSGFIFVRLSFLFISGFFSLLFYSCHLFLV